MANDLLKATGGTLDIGIDDYSSDFSAEINLDAESYNLTSGVYRGIGPRFGMATLPGHAGNVLTASSLTNIQSSDQKTGLQIYLTDRKKFHGIFAIKLGSFSDLAVESVFYFCLHTSKSQLVSGTPNIFDGCFLSTYDSGGAGGSVTIPGNFPLSSDLRQGLPPNVGLTSYLLLAGYWYPDLSLVSSSWYGSNTNIADVKWTAVTNFLKTATPEPNYVSSIAFSSSGKNIPMAWMVGVVTAAGSATVAPSVNFFSTASFAPLGTGLNCGISSDYQYQNFDKSQRNVKVYSFDNVLTLINAKSVGFVPDTTIFNDVFYYVTSSPHFNPSALTATQDYTVGAGTPVLALVNDDKAFTNTSYQAILSASTKPTVFLFQPWVRTLNGSYNQYVDLCTHGFKPKTKASTYQENGIVKSTCFNKWPNFVRGTALSSTYGVSFSAANRGILRANSTYEFTFSFYHKRLDFESNVGVPVKFQTGTDDYVCLQLWQPSGAGIETILEDTTNSIIQASDYFTTSPSISGQNIRESFEINSTEIRFYYRREGSFEWLPALIVDAAQFFLYPYWYTGGGPVYSIRACMSPVASLPGGQPGGFVDYSQLPDSKYDCVVNYKNRVWWFSANAIYFSLTNNIFCYPARNSISSRTGYFKGGLVHNYPGQAEQTSRLLIFGTKEVYVARFTGNLTTAPVQVSDTTIGEYPVDASDLIVDTWTTSTAFSHRAAVVAEGYAYWWGPTGVYKDDGVNTPRKISLRLEPRLNTLYDTSKTDDIHCSYNETAKEITWFYKPRNAGESEMRGLTWNIIDEEWIPQSYSEIIDQVFSLKIDTNIPVGGNRMIAVARKGYSETVQRPYFYDYLCDAGDMSPGKDFVVSTVATPSSGVRRLTLATGYDATNFSTLAVGDLISIDQARDYATTMTAADDMLAKIVALGTGTIDILLPTGAAMDSAATLTQPYYFPIWHATANGVGLNGFLWSIKTKYWTPFGINFSGNWLWLYILHKLNLVKSNAPQTYDISYRTPVSGDFITDTVTYADNSDGNWQLYHALRTGNQNNQGQAIKFRLAGRQIASELVLQFLELHATEETGNVLKQFEG